jgi:hypothetical protein
VTDPASRTVHPIEPIDVPEGPRCLQAKPPAGTNESRGLGVRKACLVHAWFQERCP